MQAEQQNPSVPTAQIAPETDSTPIKKQRGGKRPGDDRKPDIAKRLDAITRKLSNASQDSPQIKPNSKPAMIEA